jgi:uncharacterized FAD-dependent dehydrogenase
MGYREISLKLPTDYEEDQLKRGIQNELGIKEFSYQIENKSLDARKKDTIHWLVRVSVLSKEITGDPPLMSRPLTIPCRQRKEKAVVVGSGPAGFFSAFALQKAGIHTTIIERGSDVHKRAEGIREFEKTGVLIPSAITRLVRAVQARFPMESSLRTKHISREDSLSCSYIHGRSGRDRIYGTSSLGSDNLRKIVQNLRRNSA